MAVSRARRCSLQFAPCMLRTSVSSARASLYSGRGPHRLLARVNGPWLGGLARSRTPGPVPTYRRDTPAPSISTLSAPLTCARLRDLRRWSLQGMDLRDLRRRSQARARGQSPTRHGIWFVYGAAPQTDASSPVDPVSGWRLFAVAGLRAWAGRCWLGSDGAWSGALLEAAHEISTTLSIPWQPRAVRGGALDPERCAVQRACGRGDGLDAQPRRSVQGAA